MRTILGAFLLLFVLVGCINVKGNKSNLVDNDVLIKNQVVQTFRDYIISPNVDFYSSVDKDKLNEHIDFIKKNHVAEIKDAFKDYKEFGGDKESFTVIVSYGMDSFYYTFSFKNNKYYLSIIQYAD